MLYDNEAGTGRPISASFVESDGTANTTANSYASFYANNVEGISGAYGVVVPNTNANGIRRIEQRTLSSGSLVGCAATDADGVWAGGANTVNPTGGTTALVITSTDAPLGGNFTITASAGANGSISPNGVTSVACGNNQSYTITANACYQIANVLVDGVSQGAINSYTFTNVAATHTISATFSPITYTITASAGANGSIAPGGNVSVNCGTNQSFNISPASCYQIADVIVDGVSQGAIASYTFNNVVANHTISATFSQIVYTINASAGANGSVSPNGAVSVNCGANQTFNITPASCYDIEDVVVDGVSQGAIPSYTFNNVTTDHTIAASFIDNFVTPTISLDVFPGSTICSGTNVTFTANISNGGTNPNYEFFLNNVSVQSGSSNSYSSSTLSEEIL